MTDRIEFAQELQLRENIRRAIGIVKEKRKAKPLKESNQEHELRLLVRELISEAKKIAVYDSTGKNELNVFLLNSPFLSTLETSYRKLTTSAAQRESYIEHIIVFVNEFLERLDSLEDDEFSNDEKPDAPEEVEDKIKISVGDEEIEGEDRMLAVGPDDIKFADLMIADLDLTGAKFAYNDFKNSKTIIRDAYSNLDNEEDQADFRDELPRQIILYGRQYENSLKPELGTADVDDIEASVGTGAPEVMPGVAEVPVGPDGVEDEIPDLSAPEEEEDDIANIELQEVVKLLNIEDIIENLL